MIDAATDAVGYLGQAIYEMEKYRDSFARSNPAAREASVAITEVQTGLLWLEKAMKTAGDS